MRDCENYNFDDFDGYFGVTQEAVREMYRAFGVDSEPAPPHRPTARDRDREIANLRSEGLGLAEIGRQFGLTRERVRQILLTVGGPSAAEVRKVRSDARQAEARETSDLIRQFLRERGATTVEQAAEKLSLPVATVRRLWPTDMKVFLVRQKEGEAKWSDAQVVSTLQAAATYDFPLRTATYDALLASGEIRGPSSVRVTQRFGSWSNACAAAGVESVAPVRRDYQSKWTDDDLLAYVRRYLSLDSGGSFAGYEIWQRSDPAAPSGGTVRGRFGTWARIKQLALRGGDDR